MKKIFFSHPDIILATIAFVLLAMLIGVFSWGIDTIFFEVHRSTGIAVPGAQGGFDLKAANDLNYRGISTSTSETQVVGPSVSATPTSSIVSSTPTSSLTK